MVPLTGPTANRNSMAAEKATETEAREAPNSSFNGVKNVPNEYALPNPTVRMRKVPATANHPLPGLCHWPSAA